MDLLPRETYQRMPTDSKLDVLFDMATETYKCNCAVSDKFLALEKKVDKRKPFDTSVAGGSGLIGGFLAILGQKIFK